MNTAKTPTQSVDTASVTNTPVKKTGFKNLILNYFHLFSYLFVVIMFFIMFGCLYIMNSKYLGYYKSTATDVFVLSGGGVTLIIFAVISFMLAATSFVLNRVFPKKSKFSFLLRNIIITNIVVLYILINALAGKGDYWLHNGNSLSVGGVNMVLLCVAYSIFLIGSLINHYYGEKIKSYFERHHIIKSKPEQE